MHTENPEHHAEKPDIPGIIFRGPDGKLYFISNDVLGEFAVLPEAERTVDLFIDSSKVHEAVELTLRPSVAKKHHLGLFATNHLRNKE